MDNDLRNGMRVQIKDKDLCGTIAFIGSTSFAAGVWVGLILDEPKGKNNGSLKGVSYFNCEDNYGMFVRPGQVHRIGSIQTYRSPADSRNGEPCANKSNKSRLTLSRTSSQTSRQSLLGSVNQPANSSHRNPKDSTCIPRKSLVSGAKSSSRMLAESVPNAKSSSFSEIPNETSSKRSSFTETGFVELLKPQYSEHQPKLSPTFTMLSTQYANDANDSKAVLSDAQKTIAELRQEVKNVSEKLETITQRRAEERERLRDFDKLKIQIDQLQGIHSKIMDSQSALKKELHRAKQEAKDATEAKEKHAQEMIELVDNVEMITLDKEMAEEKCETLQLELESEKERVEELQVDLDLLRAELQCRMDGSGISEGSSFQVKQLQQQNQRLKETLVRLRDLSACDKHEIQKLKKELDMKGFEVSELEKTKEKLSNKVDTLESTLSDLQDQIDAALGAEEIVETLSDQKMHLEDKVKALEEAISDLEALEEVHEQLVEGKHELEMELREELDLVWNEKKQALRERDAAIETIYDRDRTIHKFRELVQKLNEQLNDLREKSANVDGQNTHDVSVASTGETVDYNQMFAECKAHTRAIDVQLRQIELQESKEHTRMLINFMPESFTCRGGDHDAVLVILLISRLIAKCEIIISYTRDRFPAVKLLSKEVLLQGFTAHQYAFKCRLLYYVFYMQSALRQLSFGLKKCQPELLMRAGTSLPEMVAKEKIVDGIIELLKLNQLDENSQIDHMEKCATFFNKMNDVLFSGDEFINGHQILQDSVESLFFACESALTGSAIIKTFLNEEDSYYNCTMVLKLLSEQLESLKQHARLVKRRLPVDVRTNEIGISPQKIVLLMKNVQAIGRLILVIHISVQKIMQSILSFSQTNSTSDYTLSSMTYWDLLTKTCEVVYEQDDRGPMQNFKVILNDGLANLQEIAQCLTENDCGNALCPKKGDEATISPVILRSQYIKKQLEQKNVLAATLENREADIKQLKLAAKMKQNELSEMQIRKDLAEKKLCVLQTEFMRTKEELERQRDEVMNQLEQKEKEFEETLDHLQDDIDLLQTEKIELRDKLKLAMPNKNKSTEDSNSASRVHFNTSCVFGILEEDVQLIKRVFRKERDALLQLQANEVNERLKKLKPIYVPHPKDICLNRLENDITKIKNVLALSLLKTKSKLSYSTVRHSTENQCYMSNISQKNIKGHASHVANNILREYFQRKPYLTAGYCEFASFPRPQLK